DLVKLAHDIDEIKVARKVNREILERLYPEDPTVKQLKDVSGQINGATDTLLAKLRPGPGKQPGGAPTFWAEAGGRILGKQRANLRELSNTLGEQADKATAELSAHTKSTMYQVVGLGLGLIFVVIVFALGTINTHIVGPLATLTQKTVRLSKG